MSCLPSLHNILTGIRAALGGRKAPLGTRNAFVLVWVFGFFFFFISPAPNDRRQLHRICRRGRMHAQGLFGGWGRGREGCLSNEVLISSGQTRQGVVFAIPAFIWAGPILMALSGK
ncbi:MAG: hypothetical protein FE78DRAFT_436628 [Acidomyces sp. 'richmondensis']|nr:MAG: hypothetical protein FE78DRAFT_436628 [Acidomyces sp. 'richmondensis']